MAISIDTVYQRVLTLANKEQRGYITPQEFNLLANQAQLEIFEQYFNDMNNYAFRAPGNKDEYSDPLDVLEEKISIFEREGDNEFVFNNFPKIPGDFGINKIPPSMGVPSIIHKFGTIEVDGEQVDIVNSKDFYLALKSRLTAPTPSRPIGHFTRRTFTTKVTIDSLALTIATGINNYIQPSSGPDIAATNKPSMRVRFIAKPSKAQWAYVVVNDKALYNANVAVDFELHASEETKLVYKILKLAGVNLKSQEVVQVGQTLEQTRIQQEKI
jgi:hypothetical protein